MEMATHSAILHDFSCVHDGAACIPGNDIIIFLFAIMPERGGQ